MDDNKDAIKALIEKDADKNFNPQMLLAPLRAPEGSSLENKKFTIRTRFDTSNRNGPIEVGQYFDIHLDEKLKVRDVNSLKPIVYRGETIASPEYDSKTNKIRYKIVKQIDDNISLPLNIDVDYNTEKIKQLALENKEFTVVNKISGLGVTNPKSLPPEKVDKNGNPAGSIIEPGRDDVTQIVDSSKNYRLDIDSVGNPVIENGEMVGINWVVQIESNKDLAKDLGMKMNFTLVEGSGLEKIESITSSDSAEAIQDNAINGKTGIVDSKHSVINQSTKSYKYSIYTPISNKQAAYVLDISTILTKDDNYVGAVRSVMDMGYPKDKVEQVTPTRVGINNRTTIEGKFLSNTNAQWTITDGVCTLDTNNGLPLEARTLEGANIKSGKRVVYGVDNNTSSPTYGQMVVKVVEKTNLTSIPAKESDPNNSQAVGNIGVYQFTHDVDESKTPKSYTMSGVSISKFRDLPIDQHWSLPQGYEKMPAQDINVVDKSGNNLGSVHVDAQENAKQRYFTVPNVKYWNIDGGKATHIDHKIKQTFPTGNVNIGTKQYKYNENTSYYNYNDKNHFILNSLMEVDNKKPATFKIVKVDSKTGDKLQGASFHLLGSGVSVVTDANGEATFTNIPPGTYTFQETKAPNGYKLDGEEKKITISDDGNVNVSGKNVDFSQPAGKTEVVEHNKYPNWPDYMNAMHYGKVADNGDVEFYLYLKPQAPRQGGETDRNTRLDISIPGVNITDVKAYDVSPGYRQYVKSAMEAQTANNLQLGNSVINANHNNKITGTTNKADAYTGRKGYQIYFPKERFAGDWGFLVKVKANISQNNSASLYYDWLTNEDTANQANIQKVVRLSKNTSGADDKPTITIKNTPFEKKPIEIFKFANTFTNGKR